MKARDILQQYKAGRRDFQEANLRGLSFKRKDLSGADFSGVDIRGTNFLLEFRPGQTHLIFLTNDQEDNFKPTFRIFGTLMVEFTLSHSEKVFLNSINTYSSFLTVTYYILSCRMWARRAINFSF